MDDFFEEKKEKATDKDILFSRAVKAGKRIYYLDVKKDKRDEMYLSITESKKIASSVDALHFNFEKHKIFLYKEDFDKFSSAMEEVLNFAKQGNAINDEQEAEKEEPSSKETPENLDFEIEF